MIFFPPGIPALAMATGAYYFCAVPAKSLPKGSESKARFRSGSETVVRERFSLVDDSRPTQAYNRFPGSRLRILKGEIWRPAVGEAAGPLLVYSHGFMSNRHEGLYLLHFLASHGYTAAAIDFPLTSRDTPGEVYGQDIVNQPGDISFVIDNLLERNGAPDDTLYQTIDPNKIALAGLSLGGLTTILTAFHRELLDSRVQAAICIAGPTSMLAPEFFAGNTVPALMIYANKDSLVTYEDHATPALNMIPDGILLTLNNASHTGFAHQAATFMRLMKNPDSIACRMLSGKKSENALKRYDFPTLLGGAAMGITEPGESSLPRKPLVTVAMKASRQHMFTTLAAHSFLESQFANSARVRTASRQYLLKTLPGENKDEVAVHLSRPIRVTASRSRKITRAVRARGS
jgi:pimeloyl-ACP methyl ester carboxylesterase